MKDYFNKVKEQFLSIWNNLSKPQKIITISVTSLFILLILILLTVSTKSRYVVLFNHNLSVQESGQISALLNDWNYKYKFENKKLLVNSAQKEEIMLKLGSEDKLPKESAKGFAALFDKPEFGRTEYEKKINFQRAVEGELQNMIQELDPILEAKVGITIPENKIFIQDAQSSKCSITLKLKPYTELKRDQIKGIINLAAYYVPNLPPENIWITDSNGRPLNDALQDENKEMTRIEIQKNIVKKYEKEFKRKILQTIAEALSYDKVRAEVNVQMNFDHKESENEEYKNPEFDPIKISQEQLNEEFKGLAGLMKGRPGVDENIPLYKGAEKYPLEYKKNQSTTNYTPNKKVTKIVTNPAIQRVTASVQVDGIWEEADRSKEGLPPKRTYKSRTQEEIKRISNIVKGVIGFNEVRGDKVTVEEIKFNRKEEFKRKDEQFLARIRRQKMIQWSILGAVCVVLLFIVLYELRRRWHLRQQELMRKRELAAQEELMGGKVLMEAELTPEEREKLELLKQVQDIAKDDPEMVAALLRTWLLEH